MRVIATRTIPLSDLAHFTTRVCTDSLIRVYEAMRDGVALPPILISHDGRLLAGNHRLTAARLLGRTHIDAVCEGEFQPPPPEPRKPTHEEKLAALCVMPGSDLRAVRALHAAVEFLYGDRDIGSAKNKLRPVVQGARHAERVPLPVFADQADNAIAGELIRRGFDPSRLIPTGFRVLVCMSENSDVARALQRKNT